MIIKAVFIFIFCFILVLDFLFAILEERKSSLKILSRIFIILFFAIFCGWF